MDQQCVHAVGKVTPADKLKITLIL